MTIVTNTEEKIRALLESTKREGMDTLIGHMVVQGFFTSPASSRFHGCYEGGLAKHSLDVYELLVELSKGLKLDKKATYGQMAITLKPENLIIAGLLHDLCKMGAYVRTKADDGFTNKTLN